MAKEEKFILETLTELHQRQKMDVYNLQTKASVYFCFFEYKFS